MESLARARPTLRDQEVNWGDKTALRGGDPKTLAWVSVEASSSLIVYATATVKSVPGVACVVRIEWGHGGASMEQSYAIVRRLRVPLAASMVKVSGRLLDAAGKPAPADATADVSVVIAPGSDGETLRNTRWVTSGGGAGGVLAKGPQRLLHVEGVNAGAKDTWVLLFDGAARPTAEPAIIAKARAGRRFVVHRFDSQPFRTSVEWAASSTPLSLTPDPGAVVRVDAELLL